MSPMGVCDVQRQFPEFPTGCEVFPSPTGVREVQPESEELELLTKEFPSPMGVRELQLGYLLCILSRYSNVRPLRGV